MKRRSSNLFLWLWVTIWCGGSFPIAYSVWVGNFAGNTWGVRLFILPFVAIGAGALYWLLIQIVQRQRVGNGTLNVSPSVARAGDSIRLPLQTERAFSDSHDVRFRLIVEHEHEGWSEVCSIQATALLHTQMQSANATLTVPVEARETSHRFRCRAEAVVLPWKHAPCDANVTITATDTSYSQSPDTVPLSLGDTFVRGTGVAKASPPRGAREITSGVWRWSERSRALQVLGLALAGISIFWLRSALPWDAIRRLSDGLVNVNLHVAGELLFGLPFVLGGLLMGALGLTLLFGYTRYTVERGGLIAEACALGIVFLSRRMGLTDVRVFQPSVFARTNAKASSYTMIGRTAAGQTLWYPFTAKTLDDLRNLAHWVVQRAGLTDVAFDPQLFDEDLLARVRRDGPQNDTGQRSLGGYGMALRNLMFVVIALALVGFVLMLGASFMGVNASGPEHSAAAPIPRIAAAIARDATTA